jgi:hypothetical protein
MRYFKLFVTSLILTVVNLIMVDSSADKNSLQKSALLDNKELRGAVECR